MKPNIKTRPKKFKIGLCNPNQSEEIYYMDYYNDYSSFCTWSSMYDVAQHILDDWGQDTLEAKMIILEESNELQFGILQVKFWSSFKFIYFPIYTHDMVLGFLGEASFKKHIYDHYSTHRILR